MLREETREPAAHEKCEPPWGTAFPSALPRPQPRTSGWHPEPPACPAEPGSGPGAAPRRAIPRGGAEAEAALAVAAGSRARGAWLRAPWAGAVRKRAVPDTLSPPPSGLQEPRCPGHCWPGAPSPSPSRRPALLSRGPGRAAMAASFGALLRRPGCVGAVTAAVCPSFPVVKYGFPCVTPRWEACQLARGLGAAGVRGRAPSRDHRFAPLGALGLCARSEEKIGWHHKEKSRIFFYRQHGVAVGPQWPGPWGQRPGPPEWLRGCSGHAPAPTERPWGGRSKTDPGEGQGSVPAQGKGERHEGEGRGPGRGRARPAVTPSAALAPAARPASPRVADQRSRPCPSHGPAGLSGGAGGGPLCSLSPDWVPG